MKAAPVQESATCVGVFTTDGHAHARRDPSLRKRIAGLSPDELRPQDTANAAQFNESLGQRQSGHYKSRIASKARINPGSASQIAILKSLYFREQIVEISKQCLNWAIVKFELE